MQDLEYQFDQLKLFDPEQLSPPAGRQGSSDQVSQPGYKGAE